MNSLKKYLLVLGGILLWSSCTTTSPPKIDIYKITYPGKYTAKLPNEQWHWVYNSKELDLFAPQLVKIFMKKDTGSLILVRSGRRSEFGIPAGYDLTKPEMIYLIKTIPNKGSFVGPEDYQNNDPLFEKIDKLYRFDVEHPKFGPGQIISTVTKRDELVLIEFFAPENVLKTDEPDFFTFLENLKERKIERKKQ